MMAKSSSSQLFTLRDVNGFFFTASSIRLLSTSIISIIRLVLWRLTGLTGQCGKCAESGDDFRAKAVA
jgi:hypothetical protein